jgi:hypothetical protein
VLPERGSIGTGIFLVMVFNMFKDLKSVKSRSSGSGPTKNRPSNPLSNRNYALALGLEGALVSYLVSGAFISVLYYPNIWILMGFIGSLKKVAGQETETAAA